MDGSLLDQLSIGYAPIAGGWDPRPITGLEGIPLLGDPSSTAGLLANILLGPKLQQVMASRGQMPMGIGNGQNVFDVLQRQAYTNMRRESMRQMAQSERGNWMQTARGIAQVAGVPFGAQQFQAVSAMTDMMSTAAPLFAEMAPDFMDQLGGMRGSPTVMMNRMAKGSRYQIDPMTGQMGYSAASAQKMADYVYDRMFNAEPLGQMRGFTAGQMGTLYDEMSRRGMIAAPMPVEQAVRRAALEMRDEGRKLPGGYDATKLTAGDIDKLKLDPQISDRMKTFDGERVKQSLKSYVDVLAGMRDIFGDIGKPNAPIQELMQSLEALTQGGMGQLSAAKMNMIVRQTHQLARESGVSLDAALTMQQHAAGRLQDMGISPLMAPLVTQGSLAWGGAYRAMGGGAVTAWGRYDATQMQQLDLNLRANAAASQQANQMGLLMRLRDRGGGFAAGSQAAAMAEAIEAGQKDYTWKDAQGNVQTGSTMMAYNDFRNMLVNSRSRSGRALGLTGGQVDEMLTERETTGEFVLKYDTAGLTRAHQPTQMKRWLEGRMTETLMNRLRNAGTGLSDERLLVMARQAAGHVVAGTSAMSVADFANSDERTKRMSALIQGGLKAAGAGQNVLGMGADFFENAAESAYGYVNKQMRLGHYADIGSWQNMQAVSNVQYEEAGRLAQGRNAVLAGIRTNLSGFGQGTFLQKMISAFQNAGPKSDLLDIITEAAGGVGGTEMAKALKPHMEAMQGALEKSTALHADMQKLIPGSAAWKIKKAELDKHNQIFQSIQTSTAEIFGARGFSLDQGALSGSDISKATRSMADVKTAVGDLTKMRTGTVAEQQDKYSAYIKTDEGKFFKRLTEEQTQHAGNLAWGSLYSDMMLRKTGVEGIEQSKKLQEALGEQKRLAGKYTKGDEAQWISGVGLTGEARKEWEANRAAIESGVEWLGKGIERQGWGWTGDISGMAKKLVGTDASADALLLTETQLKNAAIAFKDEGELQRFRRWRRLGTELEKSAGAKGLTAYRKSKAGREDVRFKEFDKLGKGITELQSMTGDVFDKMDNMAQAERKRAATPASADMMSVIESLGFGDDAEIKAAIEKSFAGPEGKAMALHLRDSTENLKRLGGGKGSLRDLTSQLILSKNDKFLESDMRKKYGKKYDEALKSAEEIDKSFGFSDQDKSGKYTSPGARKLGVLGSVERMGTTAKEEAQPTLNIKGSVTVSMDGTTAKIAGTATQQAGSMHT